MNLRVSRPVRCPIFPCRYLCDSGKHRLLTLQLMNTSGRSAYFPIRLVHRFIESRHLFLVDNSPLITLPVYLVYPLDRREPHIAKALEGLRILGSEEDCLQRLKC